MTSNTCSLYRVVSHLKPECFTPNPEPRPKLVVFVCLSILARLLPRCSVAAAMALPMPIPGAVVLHRPWRLRTPTRPYKLSHSHLGVATVRASSLHSPASNSYASPFCPEVRAMLAQCALKRWSWVLVCAIWRWCVVAVRAFMFYRLLSFCNGFAAMAFFFFFEAGLD